MSWPEAYAFVDSVRLKELEIEVTRLRALESKVREFCKEGNLNGCPSEYAGTDECHVEEREACKKCWFRYFGLEVS